MAVASLWVRLLRERRRIYSLTDVKQIAEAGHRIRALVGELKKAGVTSEILMAKTGKQWCIDCYADGQRQTEAVTEIDEDPLCKGCADIRKVIAAENGGSPANPFYGMHNVSQCEKIADALRAGMGINETMEAVGVSKMKVRAVEKRILSELPANCKCGRERGHRGWCADRLAKSPDRQKTLKVMHERQTTERQTMEVTEGPALRAEMKLQEAMYTVFLRSGGAIRIVFGGDIFSMAKADREFVYGLVDQLRDYEFESKVLQAQKDGTPLETLENV